MGTTVPSGSVVVVGAAVRLICCWANPATATKRRNTLTTAAAFNVASHLQSLIRIMVVASRRRSVPHINLNSCSPSARRGVVKLAALQGRQTACPYCDSSIANSRESTSIIMSMPPGKTLFVVISRSLCECHMNAQPRSLAGLACVFDGSNVVQFAVLTEGVPAPPLGVVGLGVPYGLP